MKAESILGASAAVEPVPLARRSRMQQICRLPTPLQKEKAIIRYLVPQHICSLSDESEEITADELLNRDCLPLEIQLTCQHLFDH